MWACKECCTDNWEDAKSCHKCCAPRVPRKLNPQEATIRALFERTLSGVRSQRLEVAPHCSTERLRTARGTYLRLRDDEILLGIYDSTLWTLHAKEGVALTSQGLYWKNAVFESPRGMAYSAIRGRVAWRDDYMYLSGSTRLSFKESGKITELQEALATFVKKAARAALPSLSLPTVARVNEVATLLLIRAIESRNPEIVAADIQEANKQPDQIKRARMLYERIPSSLRAVTQFPEQLTLLVVAGAFLVRVASNHFGPAGKIHIIFNPLVALLCWNLFLYCARGTVAARSYFDNRYSPVRARLILANAASQPQRL